MHSPLPVTPEPVPIDRLRRPIERIIHLENISGIALILAALVAVVLANITATSESVAHFWHTHLQISVGPISLDESLVHWVNDGLMTVFFFVAGLEIKRELVTGDLRDPRKAALPAVAALGGMVIPALLFVLVASPEGRVGWGVPMATDIAFAIGVLTLLGDRVPSKLKVFLLTLAIVDDLGAIVVIALFYTASLNLQALALAVAGLLVMAGLRWAGVWWIPAYVMLGTGVWLATFESGIHATLAGVACGLLAPAVPHRPHRTDVAADPDSTLHELRVILFDARESRSIADRLIHALHPWTALFIVPVFALANAGVAMSGEALGAAFTSRTAMAIVVGLVIGKPLGITVASYLAVKSGLATLPARVTWGQVCGVGVLGGIGFTVSLFITDLAFESQTVVDNAKVAILFASVLASFIGAATLRAASPQPEPATGDGDKAQTVGEAPATAAADQLNGETVGAGPITFAELDATAPDHFLASSGATQQPAEVRAPRPSTDTKANDA